MFGIGGGGEAGKARKQVEELSAKLLESEATLNKVLSAEPPKVAIAFPRLTPEMFGAAVQGAAGKATAYAPLQDVEAGGADLGARAVMSTPAPDVGGQDGNLKKSAIAAVSAAVLSLGIAAALAFAKLGPLVGPLVSGLTAALVNFLGLAATWQGRANEVFGTLESLFGSMSAKAGEVLDTVRAKIDEPVKKLVSTIDGLIEEQKPTLEQMQKFEKMLKTADPDFKLPTPEELKKPLDGCGAIIDNFVSQAKAWLPAKVTELASTTTVGRVALQKPLFDRLFVYLPLALVLLVNLAVAAAQVFATAQLAAQGAAQGSSEFLAASHSTAGHLAAAGHTAGVHAAVAASNATTHVITDAGSHFVTAANATSHLVAAGAAAAAGDLMATLQPAIVQVVLTLIQLLVAFALSQKERVCSSANNAIGALEATVNEEANQRIKDAVDKIFGAAFGEVKKQAEAFFPEFKKKSSMLLDALKKAESMGM